MIFGAEKKRAEITSTAETILRLTGIRTRYFRFPGGCHSKADLAIVAGAGHRAVQWDVVSGDVALRRPAAIAREVIRGVQPGSIVVMHLNGAPNAPATAGALEEIIPALAAKGFRFVTLQALLEGQGSAQAR